MPSDENLMDDEPDIDLGLDELTLNGGDLFINSGSWGNMKVITILVIIIILNFRLM